MDNSHSKRGEKEAPMTNTSIQVTEVMRYYLKCELGKVMREWEQTEQFVKSFDLAIETLDNSETIRLATVLAHHYRRNALPELWRRNPNWELRTIRSSQLLMSDINDNVKPTLLECGYNLSRFAQHLKGKGANDANLAQFRDKSGRVWHPSIIGEERPDSMIQIYDGSHRAVILASRGQTELSCYVPDRTMSRNATLEAEKRAVP
jgi:hypothetical protein